MRLCSLHHCLEMRAHSYRLFLCFLSFDKNESILSQKQKICQEGLYNMHKYSNAKFIKEMFIGKNIETHLLLYNKTNQSNEKDICTILFFIKSYVMKWLH